MPESQIEAIEYALKAFQGLQQLVRTFSPCTGMSDCSDGSDGVIEAFKQMRQLEYIDYLISDHIDYLRQFLSADDGRNDGKEETT